jgi:hypothetical protein
VYASPKDALVHLLEAKEDLNKITRTSPGILKLKNGIKYFQVEVTSSNGAQYGIAAYDEEAEELFSIAQSASKLLITA